MYIYVYLCVRSRHVHMFSNAPMIFYPGVAGMTRVLLRKYLRVFSSRPAAPEFGRLLEASGIGLVWWYR